MFPLETVNPLYYTHVVHLHITCKLEARLRVGWGEICDNPKKMDIFKQIECSHVCEEILSKFTSLHTYDYTVSKIKQVT